jgi:predicted amidohydrolase YtcJ
LGNCTSISEVLFLLKKRCEEEPGDSWVFGTGYISQLIKEGRYPTKHELDEISNCHKVMIFAATLHACALNSSGCEIAAVPDDTPGVEKKGNVPTGVYSSDESAFIANENVFGSLSDDELWRYIQDCAQAAVKKGVTSIHGLFGQFVKGDRDVEVVLKRKDELPVDMTIFYQTWNVEKAEAAGLPRVGGCLKVVDAGIKLIGGSDCPVSPVDPLRDIAHCVNGYNPIRNISMTDALKMYTITPAYTAKEENLKGSIEIGKRADLAIINKDPYELQKDKEIFHIQVLHTIKGGIVTYSA